MKRGIGVALLLTLALSLVGAPRLNRGSIAGVEKLFDRKFEALFDEPYLLLGMTRGVYLEGWGVVFSSEINLVTSPAMTPFRPPITKEEIARLRQRKMDRLPQLRKAMRDMLGASIGMLGELPGEERIALGVSLFRHSWEDTTGLPAQILMVSQRKALGDALARRDEKAIDAAIRVEEF